MILKYGNNTLNYNNRVLNLTNIITSGLTVWLDASITSSYPGTGNNWYDISGNKIDATINNCSYLSTDGGAFTLSGNGNYINVTNNTNLSLSTSQTKTMQIWIKFSATTTASTIINKLTTVSGFDGYLVQLGTTTNTISTTTNGTTINNIVSSAATININTWYFITFFSRITGTTNSTKLYVNTTNVLTTAHGNDGIGETNNLLLGANLNRPSIGGNDVSGWIGAFYFYNRELAETEIIYNYNMTKTRFGL